ncbi:uncharacterized protein LOC125655443 [Ostrea edulis]|uniref:uncharacterized protein LOC125655443 n=1 Tax=Ostrea edulis TaxID=37623 RepID=UPI0024AEE1C5|nr:uncharacterized protein LOC125655443 [Ostrea edulis]
MDGLRTTKSGSLIALVLCILFLEARYCIEANEIQSQKLCSEDVLVLLQHLSSSPCDVTDETDIIVNNRIQDERNCLVTCDIKGSIRSTSNCTSQCQSTDDSKISNSIDKEGQLDWSKQFSFCCENSGRIVSIKGRCDYTVYGRSSLKLGERCILEKQCNDPDFPLTCLRSRCSCTDRYIEYRGQCLRDGLNYGTRCMISRQCSGSPSPLICDTNERCVCSPGYFYDDSTYTCIKAWNPQLGDDCTSERQCGGTNTSMTCSSGKCACKTGYIQSHRMCLKDGLNFGTPCMISRQCSGSPSPLICDTNERCVCSPGYFYDDSTYTCIKDVKQTGGPEMQQSESEDTVIIGAAVGSGVTGVIIGVMTTLGVMFLLKRSRTRKDCDTGKSQEGRHGVYEERLEVVSKQDTYEQIGSVEEKNNISKEVVLNSESMYHVVEPTPSAPIDDRINKQEEESVYNHLFEKVEESGISNYDNPHEICAGRDNQVFVEEGKTQNAGHAKQVFDEEGKTQNSALPEDDERTGFNLKSLNNDNSESDNYFVLVKNN